MVPDEYRLEHVVARLIERLDGARRSWTDDERAREDSLRIAHQHVDAACGEYAQVAMDDTPEHHTDFLKQEVLQTFLPRYLPSAVMMNQTEAGGFGLGALARPLGRLGLAAAALLIMWVVLLKFVAFPVVWPVILVVLSLPFLPDITAMLHRRRYRQELNQILGDMQRIQDQTLAYEPAERLQLADEQPRPAHPHRDAERH